MIWILGSTPKHIHHSNDWYHCLFQRKTDFMEDSATEKWDNLLYKRSKSRWCYIPCTCLHSLYWEYERRFEDSKRMKFTASCSTNPFQEWDVSHGTELISSVSKKNASEIDNDITNLQTYWQLKARLLQWKLHVPNSMLPAYEPNFAELPRTTKTDLQALYRQEELVPS